MNLPVFNWVVALKPEAQPLIQLLNLKQSHELSGGGFNVFQNPEGDHRLVISGIGKVNAAAATAWLGRGTEKWDVWINFGIAGNRQAALGTIYRAGRVTDAATDRSWYPAAVWPGKADQFDVTEIVTVEKPTASYPESRETIEMEAAGFYQTALRFSSSELVQVIKVISDNQDTDLSDLKPAVVREIAEKAVPEVLKWIECLAKISNDEIQRLSGPEGWEETIAKFRFSETEKHQLKRQASRALILERFDSLVNWCEAGSFNSGKDVLKALDRLLSDAEGTED